MLIPTISLLFWTLNCYTIFINGAKADLSLLTSNQTQVWLEAVSQINNNTQDPRIEIIPLGDRIDITLYNDQDGIPIQNRYLFKQNIHKQVDWYLYENQLNSSGASNIYDRCDGTLFSKDVRPNLAGIYVYANNSLGIILIETSKSFQWFNNTNSYPFDRQTNLKNGTKLVLGFETNIYYNTNSDLISYNEKINDIIQQSNISINNDNQINNLQTFVSMENLSCQQHQQIVYNALRSLTFACTIQVTFKCPLQIGSACWLEEKRISNIQLNINSKAFIIDRTITVRIDV